MAGHIQNRGNGAYLLVYHIGYDAEGKRIRETRTVHAKNKTEANKKLAEFVTKIEKGYYVAPSHEKFGSFADEWLEQAKGKMAANTIDNYTYILEGKIKPAFSHFKIENVKAGYITNYLKELEDKGLSSSTIQKHYNVLSGIFKLAVKHEMIDHNPMNKVDKPSVTYKEDSVYNSDELKQLFELLNQEENTQMVLMVKLALLTGMRKGEMLALQWDDVDVANNTIHINHSLSYTKENGFSIGNTKTNNSVRKVAPPTGLMKELQKHIHRKREEKAAANELWDDTFGDLVFSTNGYSKKTGKKDLFGKPLHPDAPNRWWNRFLKRTGFKKIHWHSLRHTAATNLINKGANVHHISKRLGHSKISTTLDIYGHYLEEADQNIANILDEDYF